MADQKISQLTELTSPLSGDTLPIVNSGETKQISVGNLLSALPMASESTLGGIKVDGTTILIDEGGVISVAGGEQPSYRGFYVGVNRVYGEGEATSVNQMIFSNSTISPTYGNITTDTDDDNFRALNLDGDIVVMLNLYGSSDTEALSLVNLKTVAELFIDNVLYNGETAVTTADTAKTRFENNLSTIIAPVSANLLSDGLFQFLTYNNNFGVVGSTTGGTGNGLSINGITYNMSNDTLGVGSWTNGSGYVTGDTLTILGTNITDANGSPLFSPANDVTVTIAEVNELGNIISFTFTGTLPRPTETWPTNSINDGYNDIYDTGNYINTDISSNVPYFGGVVATGSDSSDYWGVDSEYVVVYDNSVWAIMSFGTSVTSVNYGGGSGFDSSGVKESQSLIGGGGNEVSLGNFVFNGNIMSISDDEGDITIRSSDDLILESRNDDTIIRSDDDVRIEMGYNFTENTYNWAINLRNDGEIEFYNGPEGNQYGKVRPEKVNSINSLSVESVGNVYIKSNGDSSIWTFDTSGGLNLPSGGDIKDSSGNSVLSGSNTHPYFISTDTGSAQNFKVGDNVWLGDNGTSNTLVVNGIQDSGSAFITFGHGTGHIHPYIGHVADEDANVLSVVADTTKISSAVIIGSGSLVAGDPEMLHIYSSGSYNIAYLKGNTETYAQINIQNINNTAGASSDLVLTANNGNEDNHYVNLGINSSGWEYQTSSIGYQNDAYLYNVGQDLYIGSMEPASADHGHVHIFASSSWDNAEINVLSDHKVGFNTGSVTEGFNFEFSGSVKLNSDLKVNGYIQSSGSLILQPDISDSRYVEIYNTGATDIHIKGNTTHTFLGDDTNYVKIDSTAETVTINTTSGTTVNGFVVLANVSSSLDFANDTAAEAGGVPLGGLYRNGNFIMIRMSSSVSYSTYTLGSNQLSESGACQNFIDAPLDFYGDGGIEINVGESLYQNTILSIPAPDGYYSDGSSTYLISGGSGQIGSINPSGCV